MSVIKWKKYVIGTCLTKENGSGYKFHSIGYNVNIYIIGVFKPVVAQGHKVWP